MEFLIGIAVWNDKYTVMSSLFAWELVIICLSLFCRWRKQYSWVLKKLLKLSEPLWIICFKFGFVWNPAAFHSINRGRDGATWFFEKKNILEISQMLKQSHEKNGDDQPKPPSITVCFNVFRYFFPLEAKDYGVSQSGWKMLSTDLSFDL